MSRIMLAVNQVNVNTAEIKSLKFLDFGKITNYNENKSNGRYSKRSKKKSK